jgi:homoserine dehydrogenase
LIQREAGDGENQTDIILLTHEAREGNVVSALQRIEALPSVLAKVVRLRLEQLPE